MSIFYFHTFYKGSGICFMKISGFSKFKNIYQESVIGNKLTEKYTDSYVSKLANSAHSKMVYDYDKDILELTQRIILPKTKAETVLIKSTTPSKKYCLFFPGGTSNICNYQTLYRSLAHNGISVLPVEYCGYGLNKNMEASYGKLVDVAQDAYKYLTEILKVSPKDISIVGYCLGSWPASTIAKASDCQKLILISPITRLSDVSRGYTEAKGIVKNFSPFEQFLTETLFFKKKIASKLNSLKNIENIKCPIMVMSSDKDPVIGTKFIDKFKKIFPKHEQGSFIHFRNFEDGHILTNSKIDYIVNLITGDNVTKQSQIRYITGKHSGKA